MNCPHCQNKLTPEEIKRLWGQLCQSRAGLPSAEVRKERARKAAAARWSKHRKADP